MPPASRGLLAFRVLRTFGTRPSLRASLSQNTRPPSLPKTLPPSPKIPDVEPPPRSEAKLEPEPEPEPQCSEPPKSSSAWERLSPRLKRWVFRFLLFAPPATMILLHLPVEIMRVNGPSMAPLLNASVDDFGIESQDSVLVQKMTFPERNTRVSFKVPRLKLDRGQIVVFYTPHSPEKIAVKRIVGVAGDSVTPLPGYPGGTDPVIVPHNHIWVEGDADSRDKSIDSNWYGPISQNLVIGFVKAVLTPWYLPHLVHPEQHKYPAKEQGRVAHNAVQSATLNPDQLDAAEDFSDELAQSMLMRLKDEQKRAKFMSDLNSARGLEGAKLMYDAARARLASLQSVSTSPSTSGASQPPSAHDQLTELVSELEKAFTGLGLSNEGYHRRTGPQNSQPGPAQLALQEYMENARKEREEAEAKEKARLAGYR